MPTYTYQRLPEAAEPGCGHCAAGFEEVQPMKATPLAACPKCGAPVQRVIHAPMLGNIGGKLKGPSTSSMEAAGFTRFSRSGKGTYRKDFGTGPKELGV
ncbi:MAG: hypothetical protein AMXMBFR7_15330 [Planctomycetota bacterium]